MTFVLDASTTLAFVFPDERDAAAIAAAELVRQGAAIAPVLWAWEIENAIVSAVCSQRLDRGRAASILETVARLPVRLHESPPFGAEVALAQQYDLSVYDALYLDLALRRNASLLTRDRRLAAAAQALGIGTIALAN